MKDDFQGKVTAEYKEENGAGVFIRTYFSDAVGKEDEIVQIHEIEHDLITGIVQRECYRNKDGRRHREDGPAYLERSWHTGRLIQQDWKQNGGFYREPRNFPVRLSRDPETGEVDLGGTLYMVQKPRVRLVDDNHITSSGEKKPKYRVAEPQLERL